MAFKPTDFEDCREKCRCGIGPNQGVIYTKDDECVDGYIFDETKCSCAPPTTQRIQARAYNFENCEWPIAFSTYGRWFPNTDAGSLYGGWNQYTSECPWIDLISPLMATLVDPYGKPYSFAPFLDGSSTFKYLAAGGNDSSYNLCAALDECSSEGMPSSEATGVMVKQFTATFLVDSYSDQLICSLPPGAPVNDDCDIINANRIPINNGFPKVPPWTAMQRMRKQNLVRNFGNEGPSQDTEFAMMEFYAYDSRGNPASVFESDSPIYTSGGGPQWNNLGGREGLDGFYTGLLQLGRIATRTINLQGDGGTFSQKFRPETPRIGSSCGLAQDPVGTEYGLEFEYRYQNPKYVIDGEDPKDKEGEDDYWVYVRNPGRVPTVPTVTNFDGYFRGVGGSCSAP